MPAVASCDYGSAQHLVLEGSGLCGKNLSKKKVHHFPDDLGSLRQVVHLDGG